MAEEPVNKTTSIDEQELTKKEKKVNAVKKIVEFIKKIMAFAVSKGNADAVWYKKGLYYTGAVILFVLAYVMTTHGIEIIDWLTALVRSMF